MTQKKYVNRELSWLEFNQRVLDEALDEGVPLLERLKFLAITVSNLDEFFMVRVGGLQTLVRGKKRRKDPAGMTPAAQLAAIGERVQRMTADQYACFLDDLEPALASAGIRRLRPEELSERQRETILQVFEGEIFPVLSPARVSSAEDFPLLVNQMLHVCVRLAPAAAAPRKSRFAVIPLGRAVSRFLTLPSEGGYSYLLLEDAVALHVARFFPGEEIKQCVAFRITRNADLAVSEDQAADLLSEMEQVLDARKASHCVRLVVSAEADSATQSFLRRCLKVLPDDIFLAPGPLEISAFMKLTSLPGFDELRYEAWPPQPSAEIDPATSMFETISRRSVLLYHPFDSFEPVVRLIEEAADDPDVLAVKQVLYRTSRHSPVVAALARAAEQGKYVTAIVELKARFDEARNIEWAKALEQSGVQVIYGVKGLKTHAKVCIIVRREPHGVVRYVHFGTGNYNESTARLYTDVSFMTSDEELGADASSFFNAVTGYSQPQQFRKIEAAPIGLRESILEMIEIETRRKRQGQRAHIAAKLNSLVDTKVIDALYEASQAGVPIRLNVRGICCLRPGVKGLSDNIEAVSIIDRFLEHARIFHFHHGGDERLFIGSADWMPRNLDRRVELMVPVEDPHAKRRLIEILDACFRDNVKGRRILADGSYERPAPLGRKRPLRAQQLLYEQAVEAVTSLQQSRPTVFEPHKRP